MPTENEKESGQRTWLGMPVGSDWKNWYKGMFWNASDDRIFPPKRAGVGWGFNFRALLKKMKVVK